MKALRSARKRRPASLLRRWRGFAAVAFATAALVALNLDEDRPAAGLEDVPAPVSALPLELPATAKGGSWQASGMARRLPFEPRVPGHEDHGGDGSMATTESAAPGHWLNVTVAPGDNLSLIFSRLKLPKTELHDIVSLGDDTAPLKQLKPGQTVRIRVDEGAIAELVLEMDQLTSLKVSREGGGFRAAQEVIEPEVRVTAATTSITHSLFLDGQKAGLSDAVIMSMTDIFGWDIDFALELRKDDHFSVIYEEIYKDGELVKQDRILAAEFVNQGKRHRAVLYTDDDGRSAYYSENGDAMRKAFLRTPVNFTRISSRFNLSRKHPILNTIRAHRGVDYAAPTGTPIRATADGRIRSVGYGSGYGRTVELQHGDTYSTLYAHLSRFARGLKRGVGIKQGQIIGYVGSSGLATGPHLHYEFRINGVHRNPLTVELPKALPIEQRYLADFREKSAPLLSQLDVLLARHEANRRATYVAQLDGSKLPLGPGTVEARN